MKLFPAILLSLIYCSCVNSLAPMSFKNSRTFKWTLQSSFLSSAEGNKDGADDVWGAAVGPLPTVSSKLNFGEDAPLNIKCDLWVVGSGTLGEMIVRKWKEQNPSSIVVAETLTNRRHPSYLAMGVDARLRASRSGDDMKTAKNVVICLPPSAAGSGYIEEISNATYLWAGSNGGGKMVFTSSIGVYGESNGNIVTEDFRLDTRSGRSTVMISAEEAVLKRDGSIIRLAGLYTENRGPHTFWLKKAQRGEVIETNSDGLVNMLHYEDAAGAAIAVLTADTEQKIFLAVDDLPVSKAEICTSALASKLFPDAVMPTFATDSGPEGKLCDGSKSREALKWEPTYKSFRSFMRRLGGEQCEDAENVALKKAKKLQEKASTLWLPGDEDEDL